MGICGSDVDRAADKWKWVAIHLLERYGAFDSVLANTDRAMQGIQRIEPALEARLVALDSLLDSANKSLQGVEEWNSVAVQLVMLLDNANRTLEIIQMTAVVFKYCLIILTVGYVTRVMYRRFA
ncbi:hypothetical protein FRC16_004988 [Serendipita sp. 398]|nr:hypothetical protein FRC16_004988 [Serendipita sp. 398]